MIFVVETIAVLGILDNVKRLSENQLRRSSSEFR